MASFFGSVATEVGKGVQKAADMRREDRLTNEEEARRIQLEKMRMQNESTLLDKRIKADDARLQRQLEAERLMQRDRLDADWTINAMKEQSDMWQAAMAAYVSRSKTRGMSGNGWDVKFETESSFDETGMPTTTRVANVFREGMPPMTLRDGRVIHVGQTATPHQFPSADMQKKAEDDLAAGKLDPELFMKEFKYLPSTFVFGQVSTNDQGFQKFLETENIRLPAFDSYLRVIGEPIPDRKTDSSTPMRIRPDPVEFDEDDPNALPKLSDEELAKQPTLEEFAPSVNAQRMRQDAAIGGMREGNAPLGSYFDRGPEGHLLSQGQATADMPLEQGGQLGPTKEAAAALGGQPQAAPAATEQAGGELDDAGAAEISKSVMQIMYQQSPFAQDFVDSFKPSGPEYTNPGSKQ